MTNVDDRLRSAASDVRQAADRSPLPLLPMVVASPPGRAAGWAIAAVSAVLVLVTVGGVAWMSGGDSQEATEPPVTTVPPPVTTTLAESLTPSTTTVSTTVPTPAVPISGDWVTFGTAAGLPGRPIDAIAVDEAGTVWALADTDDPTTGQLYSLDTNGSAFVARGAPLTLDREWYTLWMETTSIGIVVSIGEVGESQEGPRPPERLLQWDDAGWHELSRQHDLPDLDMSIAQRSPDGDLRVAGYTPGLGPVIIDIASDGITYATAPEGACCRGNPSVFSVPHAVVPLAPDGRSWFSNGEDGVVALGADGFDSYDAENPSGCCYVPMAADDGGVWAYFGRDLYRYDSAGWRAEVSLPLIPHAADVAAIVVTADEDVWVLGQYSGTRIHRDSTESSWTVHPVTEEQAAVVPLIGFRSSVTRDGNSVWVANWSPGFVIWRHDGHGWAHLDIPDTIDQDGTGFRQNTVVAGNGALWVATSTGLVRFHPTP